ncbi:MAG: hypothetical protein JNK84_03460 [Phreatobacter sp.]|uniref:hypothetical protein n=1 Tax=Phreatobacter sp. TaxID=1966341 RepID=UPI001A4C7BC2|nr:hypothetical protein [Phreatobacter sp.]MBL8568122.1 hypothetical protein [Phreatobacter sp.]
MARVKTNDDTVSEVLRSTAGDAVGRAEELRGKTTAGAADMGRAVVEEAGEFAANVQEKLKAVGVDTDVMLGAAKDQAGELQKLVADELKTRPLRALGLAAAAGLIVGYLSAR